MTAIKPLAYLPPIEPARRIPFDRFLPIFSPGVVQAWLEDNHEKDKWILDPLGASPRSVLEAAAAGYRVMVTSNNPVTAFEIRMLASAPTSADLHAAIAELSAQRTGSERLETHIQNLYLTRCASCGKDIQARAYLWKRDEPVPYARIYDCAKCNDSGEHPITDEDVARLQPLQRTEKLHRARALEKVLRGDREDRENVEEALKAYSSRSIYVLFTLLNKLEGMRLEPQRKTLLEALLLSLLDKGNTIWSWPDENERPRLLNTPAEFVEHNLWMSLDEAIGEWTYLSKPIKVTTWPELPRSAGICLYPGRVRDLAQSKPEIQFKSVVCIFPRPNQAFWTLSALWSSWLWGGEKAARFSSVLDRRRFDWHWHTNALHAALAPASALAGNGVKVFGIIPEPAAGLVTAVVEAAAVTGIQLSGCAVKNETENIQMEWVTGPFGGEFKPINVQKAGREAIRDLLHEIGEPTEYIEVHTAVMAALAEAKAFPPSIQLLTYEKAAEYQAALSRLFEDRSFLRRMDATAQDYESGLWWLAQDENCQTPLADRLESEMVNWLIEERTISRSKILERVNRRFPGYLTPPDALIRQCLDSYAECETSAGQWTLKPNEASEARQADLDLIRSNLDALGEKFGVAVSGDHPIQWFRKSGDRIPIYRFYLSSTAIVSRDACPPGPEGCENIFILPGSRAGLLKHKLDRDPHLRELVSANWHFLKFRTLRGIHARKDVSLELWKMLIDSDPLSEGETTQLSMFV